MAISALAERHLQIAEPGPDHLHAVATAFNPYLSPDGAGGAKANWSAVAGLKVTRTGPPCPHSSDEPSTRNGDAGPARAITSV
jgi:hypothetical protein